MFNIGDKWERKVILLRIFNKSYLYTVHAHHELPYSSTLAGDFNYINSGIIPVMFSKNALELLKARPYAFRAELATMHVVKSDSFTSLIDEF